MKIGLLIALLLFQFSIFSQNTDLDASYHFEKENYYTALKLYLKLTKKEADDPVNLYRTGYCYLMTDINKALAITYFQKLHEGTKGDPDILCNLGISHFYNYNFIQALELFDSTILLSANNRKYSELVERAKLFKAYTKNAVRLTDTPEDVVFVNLDENINSKASDRNPFLGSKNTLFFHSSRRYLSDIQVMENNIYYSEFKDGSWVKSRMLGSDINSKEDERLMGSSERGQIIFLQEDNYTTCQDISMSERKRGRFKEKKKMPKSINSKHNETGGYLSADESEFYFSSNRPGGYGGMDLYVVKKLPNDEWGEPINLGPIINSAYDEEYPYLTNDENTLYFSSNGTNSIGGFDLFVSTWKGLSNEWSEPQNLGYPINSLYDNLTICFENNEEYYAYVSDVKENGFGDYDIYKVIFNKPETEVKLISGVIALGDSAIDASIRRIESDLDINIYEAASENVIGTYSYKKNNGRYIMALPAGRYYLEIVGEGINPYNRVIEIDASAFANKDEIKQNIYLTPLKK
jgi:hypothetical protein